jgi:hypothetical protein
VAQRIAQLTVTLAVPEANLPQLLTALAETADNCGATVEDSRQRVLSEDLVDLGLDTSTIQALKALTPPIEHRDQLSALTDLELVALNGISFARLRKIKEALVGSTPRLYTAGSPPLEPSDMIETLLWSGIDPYAALIKAGIQSIAELLELDPVDLFNRVGRTSSSVQMVLKRSRLRLQPLRGDRTLAELAPLSITLQNLLDDFAELKATQLQFLDAAIMRVVSDADQVAWKKAVRRAISSINVE